MAEPLDKELREVVHAAVALRKSTGRIARRNARARICASISKLEKQATALYPEIPAPLDSLAKRTGARTFMRHLADRLRSEEWDLYLAQLVTARACDDLKWEPAPLVANPKIYGFGKDGVIKYIDHHDVGWRWAYLIKMIADWGWKSTAPTGATNQRRLTMARRLFGQRFGT